MCFDNIIGLERKRKRKRKKDNELNYQERGGKVMPRIFGTDCEGPISKNDNAFELAQEFIPDGDDFFTKLSKYDDFLADIAEKPEYKAGDTLRLILPFFKAYGVTDADIREFSEQNIVLVPGAGEALRFIQDVIGMQAFIISTSYRPYIAAMCDVIGFPVENTVCTELALDDYDIPTSELKDLKQLHDEILRLPPIEIPRTASSLGDLNPGSIRCIEKLNAIFWEQISQMDSGSLLSRVNPIGGFEKAKAVQEICERTGTAPADVFYSGDSITDAVIMKYLYAFGGCAVSFNGNRYAVESTQIVCMSASALMLAALALLFNEGGRDRVITFALNWEKQRGVLEGMASENGLTGFSTEGTTLAMVSDGNKDDLIAKSEKFRKDVRGERIGKLG